MRPKSLVLGFGAIVLAAVAIALFPSGLRRAGAIGNGAPMEADFIGIVNFGHWRLICVPGPTPRNIAGVRIDGTRETPPDTAEPARNCRVNQEVVSPDGSGHVVLAVNLRFVGPRGLPVASVRLPPTGVAGDTVALRLDGREAGPAEIRACTDTECFAFAALGADAWARMRTAARFDIVFPASENQLAVIAVPMDGFQDAVAALGVPKSKAGGTGAD